MEESGKVALVRNGYSGEREKWSDCRYILKAEQTEFADRLVGVTEKEEPMMTLRFWASATGRMELPLSEMGKGRRMCRKIRV